MTDAEKSTSRSLVVCDTSAAPDTVLERIESYRQLFLDALVARERVGAAVQFRFRADDAIEASVPDLAHPEKQCCAFFTFSITRTPTAVIWDSTVIDDDTARAVLDEWFYLPETVGHGAFALQDRMTSAGLRFTADPLVQLGEPNTTPPIDR